MKREFLKDIRCYTHVESTQQHTHRYLKFHYAYEMNKITAPLIAEQFVKKLKELDFQLTGFNHVFILFIQLGVTQSIKILDFTPDKWAILVDCGLNLSAWNTMDDKKKHALLIDCIANTLKAVTDHDQNDKIDMAVTDIKNGKLDYVSLPEHNKASL